MSLQLRKRNVKLSTIGLTGAAVVAAGVVLVTTFPHIKTCVLSVFCRGKSQDEDDTTDENVGDVSEWSVDDLKSFLKEVCCQPLKVMKERGGTKRHNP